MPLEQLSPDTLTGRLIIRRKELNQLLTRKLRNLKSSPEGRLRIAQAHRGRKLQYFHMIISGDTKGNYIPHANLALARRLAQKDYDTRLIKELRQEIQALQKYLDHTKDGAALSDLYTKLCPARQQLVTPVTLTDDQYAAQWQTVSWTGLPFSPDSPDYTTARGERVRSKSEVIIADTLARHGIPYRYEFPLELNTGRPGQSSSPRTIHPDFLCLNVRTRAEFYWEHFGLMDNPDYLDRTLAKLKDFPDIGLFPGKNLLFTMESATCHLSTRNIENLITEFLI